MQRVWVKALGYIKKTVTRGGLDAHEARQKDCSNAASASSCK